MRLRHGSRRLLFIFLSILILTMFHGPAVSAEPVVVTDAVGRELHYAETPRRVVSLVPAATEILAALGCQERLAGITLHDTKLQEMWNKPVVGGYFAPSMKAVAALAPDLIIAAPHHQKLLSEKSPAAVQVFDTQSLADAVKNIETLGRIFDKGAEAKAVIDRNRAEMALIREKTNRIPKEKHLRVMRLMGRDKIMTPGDESFQNEMIAAAGGIPPRLGKTGDVAEVTLDEWRAFNPQVVYGCGDDLPALKELLQRPGWKDADAVRDGRMYTLPCDLTCRAATHVGYFVSWLASLIYTDEFADSNQDVLPEGVIRERSIPLDLPYVKSAWIIYSRLHDFENKSLLVDFTEPQTIVSTLEGSRTGILSVGNHYTPAPCWAPGYKLGLDILRRDLCRVLDRPDDSTSFLVTGADMDHLSVQSASFKDMTVVALVTAGVESNALRASKDSGDFYEPGTINIIILTNMALTPMAMTGAIVTATEAKTAALWDMDVRSAYSPLLNAATGTGTDNVLVVGGRGKPVEYSGGHTKMGELIAKTVYGGVQEAVRRQNGLTRGRGIFDRLADRRISIFALASEVDCECRPVVGPLAASVEELLLDSKYAGFLESALVLSDAHERGGVSDLTEFHRWGEAVAEEIAGTKIGALAKPAFKPGLPVVIREALGYLFAGVIALNKERQSLRGVVC